MEQAMSKISIVVCNGTNNEGKVDDFTKKMLRLQAIKLGRMGYHFDWLVRSGFGESQAAAEVMREALGVKLDININEGFAPQKNIFELLAGRKGGLGMWFDLIKEKGGTVEAVLNLGRYNQSCGNIQNDMVALKMKITDAVLGLALDMETEGVATALVISHSPGAEFATVNQSTTPYAIETGVCICYTINGVQIIKSDMIPV